MKHRTPYLFFMSAGPEPLRIKTLSLVP